jgi:glycosyltransferase involved in cell wall biosynthesis
MNIALVVPGGVDRSGEYRVIPALLALIKRLSLYNAVHVFALEQEPQPGSWDLAGARIHNIGAGNTRLRAVRAICAQHRLSPFQIVHAIWSGSPGLVAVTAAKFLRIASLVHIAGGEVVGLPEIDYGGSLKWRGRIREAVVLRAATTVTSASSPIIETLSRLGIVARRVPLGVDLGTWPPRAPQRRDLHRPARLIHAASLNRVKDQRTLLRALACLADAGVDFSMDVVGEDTLHGEIQTLAAQLQLSTRVRFHGFLTQSRLRPLMEAADLMVHSSRHETGPLVVLEAAVAGVPTVGTAVGHIAEWSPDAARSVAVGDWAGLAKAIEDLLGDEDLRLRIAKEAFQRSTKQNADQTAARFAELYATAIASLR